MHKIGIRREDKNEWERRVPIIPDDMAGMIKEHSMGFVVQSSSNRIFSDEEFIRAGAEVRDHLQGIDVVFAVKEIPVKLLSKGATYIYFSHTVKGQPYNMEMLRRLMQLECSLIDYERITDEQNRRLIFFGRHAGLAGMIDTLWALGRRLEWEGISPNPFGQIQQTLYYESLDAAKNAIADVAEQVKKQGLPEGICPMVTGFAGYGNVSLGAQEILDLFPVETLEPEALESYVSRHPVERNKLAKVVFKEEHMVRPLEAGKDFVLQDYYDHPEKYGPAFERYVPFFTLLMNCIYWDTPYPRLVTKEAVRALYAGKRPPRLKVVGDVSCDIDGAVEFTVKSTMPDKPVFVYEPGKDRIVDGVEGNGPVVMAVDNLPCELALEASNDFSKALTPYLAAIAKADYRDSFEELQLPMPIKRAMILLRGAFTPEYRFMEEFIH